MAELALGVVGVLVGAAVVFLAEMWRQVLLGRSAARIIRSELLLNAAILDRAAIGVGPRDTFLTKDAWEAHGATVVHLLTDEVAGDVLSTYVVTTGARDLLIRYVDGAKPEGEALESLRNWNLYFRRAAFWMLEVSSKSRLRLLYEHILGKPRLTSPDVLSEPIRERILQEEVRASERLAAILDGKTARATSETSIVQS